MMFTERSTITSKRHYSNFCLVSIEEFDFPSILRSYHTSCCFFTSADLLLIYSSLHSCWLNQFGTRLELAIDDQQQQQQSQVKIRQEKHYCQ